ncbi:MAG: 4-(cytidine 5'-diphospho)-2-C-methyl-D-erythritol kinase [Lachnospiraceae bacterium]|nr:4-(cytidine 5'-diphospho)-2-C-methyl-D-erythritol kinase [Lachnospiraceae bacterium]
MEQLYYKARAKINLGLDVCGRLGNGYHEVKMIMQTIDLFDELEFKRRNDPDIILSVSSRDFLGDLENNLIFKAAKLMKQRYHIRQGVEIRLKKKIPVAAGMAGGSTDAAATMLAMNELYELGLSKEQLMEEAVRLGADIPFCIMEGTALAEGIGEKLTPLPAPPKASLLVVKPPVMVPTKWVYDNLHVDELSKHPDIDGMVTALKEGNLKGITDRMENVMESVTEKRCPIIMDIKKMMLGNGAMNAVMSGSGPSIFGVFLEEDAARAAAVYVDQTLRTKGIEAQVNVTEFYNPQPIGGQI